MNNIIITGNISNVELKSSANGKKYTHFSICHSTKKADGTFAKGYLNLTAFGSVAERLSKFKQGSALEIVAHFNFGSYTPEDGKTRNTVEYHVDNFFTINDGCFIPKKEANGEGEKGAE